MTKELVVGFTPVRAAERVARWHGKLRTHLILLAVAVALALGLLIWQGFALSLAADIVVWLIVLIPAGFVAADIVFFVASKRDLGSVGEGEALVVARQGLTVRDSDVAWRDIRRVSTRPGGVLRSSLLAVEAPDATLTLPLDFIDCALTDIDKAVRAASSGRVGVEVSPLEVVQRP